MLESGDNRQLSLRWAQALTDRGLDRLREREEWAATLVGLDLGYCDRISDGGMVALCPQLGHLRTLSLCGCRGCGDATAEALGRHCRQLISLNLELLTALTDIGVQAVVRGCASAAWKQRAPPHSPTAPQPHSPTAPSLAGLEAAEAAHGGSRALRSGARRLAAASRARLRPVALRCASSLSPLSRLCVLSAEPISAVPAVQAGPWGSFCSAAVTASRRSRPRSSPITSAPRCGGWG